MKVIRPKIAQCKRLSREYKIKQLYTNKLMFLGRRKGSKGACGEHSAQNRKSSTVSSVVNLQTINTRKRDSEMSIVSLLRLIALLKRKNQGKHGIG